MGRGGEIGPVQPVDLSDDGPVDHQHEGREEESYRKHLRNRRSHSHRADGGGGVDRQTRGEKHQQAHGEVALALVRVTDQLAVRSGDEDEEISAPPEETRPPVSIPAAGVIGPDGPTGEEVLVPVREGGREWSPSVRRCFGGRLMSAFTASFLSALSSTWTRFEWFLRNRILFRSRLIFPLSR